MIYRFTKVYSNPITGIKQSSTRIFDSLHECKAERKDAVETLSADWSILPIETASEGTWHWCEGETELGGL